MANSTVGVLQSNDPDRLIDNEQITIAGQSVWRQRIVLTSGVLRVLLDPAGRSDGQPTYVGEAPQGTALAANEWIVQKLFYDASGNLREKQTIPGVWNNRAILAWAPEWV